MYDIGSIYCTVDKSVNKKYIPICPYIKTISIISLPGGWPFNCLRKIQIFVSVRTIASWPSMGSQASRGMA